MAYKDFFGDLDPLAEVRDTEPSIPTKAKPVQKQTVSVEDPFTDLRMDRETMNAEQLREDMRLMYRMIEGTRDDLRQRDREYAELREEMRATDNNRERDMLALMEKLSEIQLEMTTNRDSTKSKTGLVDSPKFDPNLSIKKEPLEESFSCQNNNESTEKRTETAEPNKKSSFKTKPATYDGSTSWIDYRSHFDMCAELNNWTIQQKGLYLGVSLRGLAQGVLGNLPLEKQKDFEELSKALSERFSPESQTELYRAQLKEREWKHGENVAEFGQRILRLTTLAYPKADPCLINSLAMGFFVDAISDSEMRLKIKQTRPKDLNEAVKVAVELEAFDRAERQRRGQKYIRQTHVHMEENAELNQIVQLLEKEKKDQALIIELINLIKHDQKKESYKRVNSVLKNNHELNTKSKHKKKCFNCGDDRHLANTCPKKTKCFACNETRHKSFECPKVQRKPGPNEKNVQVEQPSRRKVVMRAGAITRASLWRENVISPAKTNDGQTEALSEEKRSLRDAQLADHEIKLIRSWVLKKQRPKWERVSGMSNRVKSYWSQFQRLCIHDDLLCRIWYDRQKPERYQIIVPKGMRETMLQKYHDPIAGDHFGIQKTLEMIRQEYYWAGYYTYVVQYVSRCNVCSRLKASSSTKSGAINLTESRELQNVIQIDRMKLRYKREESDEVSRGNNEVEVLTQEADSQSSSREQEVVEEVEEVFYDAEEQIEVVEELGRGRRERRQPQRFSDFVM